MAGFPYPGSQGIHLVILLCGGKDVSRDQDSNSHTYCNTLKTGSDGDVKTSYADITADRFWIWKPNMSLQTADKVLLQLNPPC